MNKKNIWDIMNSKEIKEMIGNKNNSMSVFTEEKQVNLVKDICNEIQTKDIPDLKLAGLMRTLPSEYCFDILLNLPEKKSKDLISLFESIYYGDFLKEIKETKYGITTFEKRIKAQTLSNAEKFLKVRILTKHELELLAQAVCEDDENLTYKPLFCYKNYQGDNKYLKILVKANKVLSLNRFSTVNTEILNNITDKLLEDLLNKLKEYNTDLTI